MLLHCLMAFLILSLSLLPVLYLLSAPVFLTSPHIILLFLTFNPFIFLPLIILWFSHIIHNLSFLTPLLPSSVLVHLSSISVSFLFFISLSAAMLWRCSDLQPSLDRVRSASTTCLRPDTNFHSPERDRYKKRLSIPFMNRVDLGMWETAETSSVTALKSFFFGLARVNHPTFWVYDTACLHYSSCHVSLSYINQRFHCTLSLKRK